MMLADLLLMASGGTDIEDVFATTLYTGNGSTQSIRNRTQDFGTRGGMLWIKKRSGDVPIITSPGVGTGLTLSSALTLAVANDADTVTAFNNNGFSLGADTKVNANTEDYVAWLFRSETRFFDTVTYTGNGVQGRTISHNLGVTPGVIIIKNLDRTAQWSVAHRSLTAGLNLVLDQQVGANNDGDILFDDVMGDASTFSVGNNPSVNASGEDHIAFLFAHDTQSDGMIQCGGYVGNNLTAGPSVSLGWEPQWLLVKRADGVSDWFVYDSARSTSNPRTTKIEVNSGAAEDTVGEDIDFTSTGFQIKAATAEINANGGEYIYVAIRA